MNKKTIIGVIGFFIVLIVVLFLLVPVAEKNKRIEQWGRLAEEAETNSMAEYIIENEALYTKDIIDIYYSDNEKLEFVYNYAFHKDDYITMNFTNEELKSDTVPALYMNDPRWGYEYINEMTISESGCAGVAVTMANLYLNNNGDADPVRVMDVAKSMSAITIFDFVVADYISDIALSFGMKADGVNCYQNQKTGVEHNELIAALDEENAVVMVNMMSEPFGNHMIIIRGYNDKGYYINDPASPENTAMLWDYETIEQGVAFYWIVTSAE